MRAIKIIAILLLLVTVDGCTQRRPAITITQYDGTCGEYQLLYVRDTALVVCMDNGFIHYQAKDSSRLATVIPIRTIERLAYVGPGPGIQMFLLSFPGALIGALIGLPFRSVGSDPSTTYAGEGALAGIGAALLTGYILYPKVRVIDINDPVALRNEAFFSFEPQELRELQ